MCSINSWVNRCAAKDKNPRSNMSNIAYPVSPNPMSEGNRLNVHMDGKQGSQRMNCLQHATKKGHVRVRLSSIKPLPLNINQPNFAIFDLVHIPAKETFWHTHQPPVFIPKKTSDGKEERRLSVWMGRPQVHPGACGK